MIEKHNLDIDIHSKLSYTGDNAEGGIDNMVIYLSCLNY